MYFVVKHLCPRIDFVGVVTRLAGGGNTSDFTYGSAYGSVDGTGSAALFCYPYGITVDGFDTVYVADTSNNLIRMISTSGSNVNMIVVEYVLTFLLFI